MIAEAVRALAGLVYVLFIPGYIATWALYPKKDQVDVIERIALSFGLSLALSVLPMIALNYAGLAVNAVNVFLVILLVILVSGIITLLRLRFLGS